MRHGTTTLFAALEITGTDACHPRHTHAEFLAFLKQVAEAYPRLPLHVVADDYATHQQFKPGWPTTRECRSFHPDLWIVAEPGRSVLRNHHPPSDPARHVHLE